MRKRPSKLVIGIGNPLRRDDGIGIEAAARLARCQLPPDVEIFDGGTAGLDLATVIEDRELVIIVDGVELDEAPGTIYELDTEELRPGSDSGLSVHDFHLLHALDETRLLGRASKTNHRDRHAGRRPFRRHRPHPLRSRPPCRD